MYGTHGIMRRDLHITRSTPPVKPSAPVALRPPMMVRYCFGLRLHAIMRRDCWSYRCTSILWMWRRYSCAHARAPVHACMHANTRRARARSSTRPTVSHLRDGAPRKDLSVRDTVVEEYLERIDYERGRWRRRRRAVHPTAEGAPGADHQRRLRCESDAESRAVEMMRSAILVRPRAPSHHGACARARVRRAHRHTRRAHGDDATCDRVRSRPTRARHLSRRRLRCQGDVERARRYYETGVVRRSIGADGHGRRGASSRGCVTSRRSQRSHVRC